MVVLPTKAISGEITDQFTTTVDVEVIVESKLQHLAVQKKFDLTVSLQTSKSKNSACKESESAEHWICASVTIVTITTVDLTIFFIRAWEEVGTRFLAQRLRSTPLAVTLQFHVGILVLDFCRYFETLGFVTTARTQFGHLAPFLGGTLVALKGCVLWKTIAHDSLSKRRQSGSIVLK